MKAATGQMAFGFVQDIDRQIDADRARDKYIEDLEHCDYELKSMMERHPPTAQEWDDVLVRGMRLGRFVHRFECRECLWDCQSHIPDEIIRSELSFYSNCVEEWQTKLCLRDWFSKCIDLEYLPADHEEAHATIIAGIERRRRWNLKKQPGSVHGRL